MEENMATIWQTVLAIVASFGGAGAIILAVSKWLANLAAEKAIKKMDFEYSKKIESLKDELDKKNYMRKVRFDLEIKIYQDLSETFLDMCLKTFKLFPSKIRFLRLTIKDIEELKSSELCEAKTAYNTARFLLLRNSAFIPEDIYKKFLKIETSCLTQLDRFAALLHMEQDEDENARLASRDIQKAGYDYYCSLSNETSILFNELRQHISTLDMGEN
jgi:hypothetical protein